MPTRVIFGGVLSFDFIDFDADLQRTMTDTNTVTRHKVETGADVTDHIRRDPATYTLRSVVSNSALLTADQKAQQPADRAEEAYQRILEKLGTVVAVETPKRIYTQMVIESISNTEDGTTGDAMDFEITFVELRRADSQDVAAPVTEVKRAKPGEKAGRQESTEASADNADAAGQSVLSYVTGIG